MGPRKTKIRLGAYFISKNDRCVRSVPLYKPNNSVPDAISFRPPSPRILLLEARQLLECRGNPADAGPSGAGCCRPTRRAPQSLRNLWCRPSGNFITRRRTIVFMSEACARRVNPKPTFRSLKFGMIFAMQNRRSIGSSHHIRP